MYNSRIFILLAGYLLSDYLFDRKKLESQVFQKTLTDDEYIKVEQNWAFLGLTIVKKKKHFDYKDNQNIDWEHVFERRKFLLSHL